MNLAIFFLFMLAAYLLGSLPFGLFAGRLKGIDIRQHGSGNIGATNVFRVVGKKWGITVLLLDALKGYLACRLPFFFGFEHLPLAFSLALGIIAILGHSFSFWLKFHGGKGVATSLGVFLAICWLPTLITFGIWILIFTLTHIISISSLVAAIVFPMMVGWSYAHSPDLKLLLPISIFLALFIFYTHRANIQRLLRKTEKKLF